MNKNIKYVAVIFACLSAACNEYEMLTYDDAPAICFPATTYEINHSFFLVKSAYSRDTVYVTVRTMGAIAYYDRPVKLIQKNSSAEYLAEPGKHYVAFDDDEVTSHYVIKAGEVEAKLPVILLRHDNMLSNTFTLAIGFEANEYFKLGVSNRQTCTITTGDFAAKPDIWDSFWKTYFGEWGSEKMRFIIEKTGFTEWDTKPVASYCTYLKAKVKLALAEYNAANLKDPLAEADGTHVTFPN